MDAPRVTAIILNYNLTDYTIDCVRSLGRVTYPSLDIMVVDNGSTDQPVAVLREQLPGVDVRSTGENLGYTGGINAGFRYAMGANPDYILVLNPDTLVEPDFLTHLVDAMENRPTAAGACGTIYAEHDRILVWYGGGRMIPFRGLAVHENMNRRLEPSSLGPPRPVSFITGCMILFRTSALAVTGTEDERFFMALDDIEFSARIQRKGFELLYVPRSIIYHKVFGEKESPFKAYYSIRNRLLLIRTAWGGGVRLVASAYFLSVIIPKLALWFFLKRPFFHAARMGLADYWGERFGKGRGVETFRYREDL